MHTNWTDYSRAMLTALGLLAGCISLPAPAQTPTDVGARPPGAFDYYVLALSWEPGFCAANPKQAKSVECTAPKGFGLHGLWPELEDKQYPTNCSTVALTANDRRKFGKIYADPTLIDHEWPKHGTCSGLTPSRYFALSKADVAKVVIPKNYRKPSTLKAGDIPTIERAIIAANPGMTAQGITALSQNGQFTEIEICITKAGLFRTCT